MVATVVTQDVSAHEGDTVIYMDNDDLAAFDELPSPLFGFTAAGKAQLCCKPV